MTSLALTRARSYTITATVGPNNAAGLPALGSGGITGWQFWLTAKYDPTDPDTQAVFQKLPAAWQVTQAGNSTTPGLAICNIVPADTLSVPLHQVVLQFDITAEDGLGNFYMIDGGTITIAPDVTQVAAG